MATHWLKYLPGGKLYLRTLCGFGRHQPARKSARKLNGVWNTECKNCRAAMIRDQQGWVLKFAPGRRHSRG